MGLFTYEDWCPHESRRETERTPCEGTDAQRDDSHVTVQAETGVAAPELHVEGGEESIIYTALNFIHCFESFQRDQIEMNTYTTWHRTVYSQIVTEIT